MMSEPTPICLIQEKYSWLKCQNPPLPGDPDVLCILHSRQEDKDHDGKFQEAINHKLAAEDYDFHGVFFPGIADFCAQKFNKVADFSDATFQKVNFEGAIFSEKVNFRHVNFNAEANFSCATFFDEADFFDSIFSKGVDFSNASFFGKALFYELKLSGNIIFIGANISGNAQVIFRFINSFNGKIPWIPFSADFGFLKQEIGGRLIFQNLSLAKITFSDTDLLKMEFNNVDWASYYGRSAVYDEIHLHQRKWANIAYFMKYRRLRETRKWRHKMFDEEGNLLSGFSEIERIYRQLKINYEEKRDFKQVGDFHYGEMEMHRRTSFWRQWVPFSWYNLYRALSGYGERPLRALTWLAFFLVAMAGLVWSLGLQFVNPSHIANFGDSFLFILQKATLQRPAWAEPINFLGKLVAGFSVLFIPGQAALFLLALRNRLGRRR
jgi:uncharacterized protein YjbI with pentapeptide repeats